MSVIVTISRTAFCIFYLFGISYVNKRSESYVLTSINGHK